MPTLNLLDLRLAALFSQNIIKQSPVNSVYLQVYRSYEHTGKGGNEKVQYR